jgi:hypothetical protein
MPDPFRSPDERGRARIERHLRYGRVTNLRPDVVVGRDDQGQFFGGPEHIAERYLGEIEAPPDFLTDDQLDVFEKDLPTDTPERISGFLWRCNLECADAPSVEDVRAEIALRNPHAEPRRVGPPRGLTPDQRAIFDESEPEDTPESISGFRAWCAIDCEGDPPSAEDVKAAIAERDAS